MRQVEEPWIPFIAVVATALAGCTSYEVDQASVDDTLRRCEKQKSGGCPGPGTTDGGTTSGADGSTTTDGSTNEAGGAGGAPKFDPGAPSQILAVGPGKTYATPCAAIAAAPPNAEIDVAAGTYTDSCEIKTAGLRLKGVGGRPKIDLSGSDHPFAYKGIYVVSADNVYIENLELIGAHISDENGANGAGLRVTGHGLVVHGCYFHDNQAGILGGPLDDAGNLTIEYSEFAKNGTGDGCNTSGCTHNVYLGAWDKVLFRFNWSHDIANDTADKGHLFKSRAKETQVLYNRLTGEGSTSSYEVDLPNGGVGIIVGNVVQQGTGTGNPTLLSFGAEGLRTGSALYVAYNTFVNDRASGTFINLAAGASFVAHDNVFAGAGTLSTTGALPADNLSGVDPLFVAPASYDYHLQAGSPAIGKAVDPGTAGTFSLKAAYEYVHPASGKVRATAANVGAFE